MCICICKCMCVYVTCCITLLESREMPIQARKLQTGEKRTYKLY